MSHLEVDVKNQEPANTTDEEHDIKHAIDVEVVDVGKKELQVVLVLVRQRQLQEEERGQEVNLRMVTKSIPQ